MGGDVEVRSILGKGSVFSVTAQLQSSQQSQRVLPQIDISKLNLLIVDDNLTNLEVLRGQLQHWGATVTEAISGQAALTLCQSRVSEGKKNYDVALLDMQMPEMDGAELGKALRSDSRFDSMKLVMMTSIASQSEATFFSELGFNAYFPKPATTSDLFRALSVVVDNDETFNNSVPLVTHDYLETLIQTTPVDNNLHFDKASVNILLVEDNKVNQQVALGILEVLEFNAEIAGDGKQALEMLERSIEKKHYQLIFMDCQMPVMDGYQTTQNIRKGAAGIHYKSIPIIAMTANAMQGDREKCIESGMNDYIGKPIDPLLLETKLYNWLGAEKTALTDIEAITETIKREAQTQDSFESQLPCWHQEGALKRLLNKEDLLLSLMKTFLEEMPEKIAQLNDAIKRKEKKEVALLAHAIKGSSANLSAIKLTHYCAELEKKTKYDSHALDDQNCLMTFDSLNLSYVEIVEVFTGYLETDVPTNDAKSSLSRQEAIMFLTKLHKRLVESDYIESEELSLLKSRPFSLEISELIDELQHMITLFDLDNAQKLVESIIVLLQKLATQEA